MPLQRTAIRPLSQLLQPARASRVARRPASTAAAPSSTLSGFRIALYGSATALTAGLGWYYFTDTRSSAHRYIAVPLIRAALPDPEDAHHFGVKLLQTLYRMGCHPRERNNIDEEWDLSVEVFGRRLSNPIGISGGLDKNAEIPDALFALGPAVVEVGGITPLPQYGNPKPRVFRVTSQEGLVNRYGLNSLGASRVATTLKLRLEALASSLGYRLQDVEKFVPAGSLQNGKLLAVQVAKNKSTPDDDLDAVAADYATCVKQLGQYADIIVCNVSSPNTPGLRELQRAKPLTKILTSVVEAAQKFDRNEPLRVMVKVSPDENSPEQIATVAKAVWDAGVDGVIVANTTLARPMLPDTVITATEKDTLVSQSGGFSGPALFPKTLDLVRRYKYALEQQGRSQNAEPKVIFASGGVKSGQQALELLDAGASVVMIYTAMTYGGVGTVSRIKKEITEGIKEKSKTVSGGFLLG